VLSALRRHRDDPRVAEIAARAIAFVAATEVTQGAIEAAGGVDDIIATLTRHIGDVRTVEHTLWALCNLSAHPQIKMGMQTNGAIDALAQAIKAHPADRLAMHQALRCVASIAANSEHRTVMTDAGFMSYVLDAMSQCENDLRVQYLGCLAASSLRRHHQPAKEQFVALGGKTVAQSALDKFGDEDAQLRSAARRLLKSGREWPQPSTPNFIQRTGIPLFLVTLLFGALALALSASLLPASIPANSNVELVVWGIFATLSFLCIRKILTPHRG